VIGDRTSAADPALIHKARAFIERSLGQAHADLLGRRYASLADLGPYRLTPEAMGRRSLRNMCLRYLMAAGDGHSGGLARAQFGNATNMTDLIAALGCLVNVEGPDREAALQHFYGRFEREELVIDKWF